MDQKEFQKWLTEIDKQISEKSIDLGELNLEDTQYDFLEKFVSENSYLKNSKIFGKNDRENDLETEKNEKKNDCNGKKNEKQEQDSKNLKNQEKDYKIIPPTASIKQKSYNKELTFNPKINKNSVIIANSLGNSKERLLSKNNKKNYNDFEVFSNTSMKSESSIKSSDMNTSNKSSYSTKNSLSLKNLKHTKTDLDLNVQKMLDWNKNKLEKQRCIKEENKIAEVEECTFQPKIKEMPKAVKPLNYKKKPENSLIKKGYSLKAEFQKDKSSTACESIYIPDLTSDEYEHAVKRLHWELNSIILK